MATIKEYVLFGVKGWLVTRADGSNVFFAYRDRAKAEALMKEEA